jgi:hypothetical protein
MVKFKPNDLEVDAADAAFHEGFFRDRLIVLLIKVFNRVAESLKDSTLPIALTYLPYLVTNAGISSKISALCHHLR